MKVDLKDLREGPLTLTVNTSPGELELEDPDFRFEHPVTGEVVFKKTGDRILAHGKLQTKVSGSCVRCLTPVVLPVSAPVDAIYENDDELRRPDKQAFNHEDQIITWFDGESIHPEPELRESLMLELPTLPLCAEHCRGLCPQCGHNRNEGPCDCPDAEADTGAPEAPPEGLPNQAWKAALKNIKLDH